MHENLIDELLPANNILIYDIAAESRGGMAVLQDFYDEVANYDNKKIHWYFMLSKLDFPETQNITVMRYEWIKKSWLHRLFFDHFIAPSIVRKLKIDTIFSMQNVRLPINNVRQVLYIHQALPFVDYKFKIKEDFMLYIYQNLIGAIMINNMKRVDKIVVQTNWVKKACAVKTGIDANKIVVVPPKIHIIPPKLFKRTRESLSTFFYPAAPSKYKNHEVIIKACEELVNDGCHNFKVIFTFTGNENKLAASIKHDAQKKHLPIQFVGNLSREQVFEYYTKSVLIFPSYVETFGMPLLEAKQYTCPIIASNCLFAHEILEGYQQIDYFNFDNEEHLFQIIKFKYLSNN